MASGWLSMACTLTSAASRLTSFGFGAAKASTKFGFSIARGIASVTPIPLLTASLDHLESLSLLPILLGESIASTSFDAVFNLLDADDEASFSLAAFVTMVRDEWEEHVRAGRSVTEVARAVAAWAAIQGFTKQWSEERWLKDTTELTHRDFAPPERANVGTQTKHAARRRAISRVSVTDDVIMPGQLSQVISADIGEKVTSVGVDSLTTAASKGTRSPVGSNGIHSPLPFRSNYESWKNLRRFSKMVLAGYGGAGLIFFGTPLQPTEHRPKISEFPTNANPTPHASFHTDSEVKDVEEDILIHVVEDAEAEAMSPPMRNVPFPKTRFETPSSSTPRHRTGIINSTQEHSPAAPSSSYSWWNVLLGKHDREIFEGFAFTPVDDSDKYMKRSKDSCSLEPSTSCGQFHSLSSSQGTSFMNDLSTITSEGLHQSEGTKPSTAIIGDMRHMPRFWVLTDHGRQQVVLVVRGTMSFNELAADLTCEPESFQPATASSPALSKPVNDFHPSRAGSPEDVCLPQTTDIISDVPFPVGKSNTSLSAAPVLDSSPSQNCNRSPRHRRMSKNGVDSEANTSVGSMWNIPKTTESFTEDDLPSYQVHGGMLRMARAMGSKGKPVHQAVSAALWRNRGYELILCGHSLGAGVASLLALMWTDPTTCRTVPASGLPSNRRVSVYCFAPPCITSPLLSRLCENLITSIVYSFDVVSRLSLGSIRDLNKAAFWLCEGRGEESTVSLLRRALKGKLNFRGALEDTEDEKKWFIAVRKTLEANMSFSHLFPPGRIWWALRNDSLHPSHQSHKAIGTGLRLFEVQKVEEVFRQIEFKGDMLSSHLPHQYDRMLTELEF